jgi:glycosyltransferase involved in cell wall biosynthesis
LRLPLAVSLHGSDIFVAQRHPVFRWVVRSVFRQAAVVTACSPDLAAGAIDLGAAPDKVHIIPYGVDPARFHPAVTPLARADFGLAADDIVLASVGRVVPKKGFDVLIRALPAIRQSAARVHLLIGGEGPQIEALRHLAEELGVTDHVHLPGVIPWDRVPAFLAMCDLFVLPSVRDAAGNMDGLPNVLLEAMAMGKPVVASQLGGVPLVIRDGENGLLCPPGDAAALSEALRSLIADGERRKAFGAAARRVAEEQHSWASMTQQLAALFATDPVRASRVLPSDAAEAGR